MSFGYQEPIEAIVLPEENEPLLAEILLAHDGWIVIQAVVAKHVGYGRYDFTGRVNEASQIWPWLKPGEHVSCEWYDVIDWRSAPNV